VAGVLLLVLINLVGLVRASMLPPALGSHGNTGPRAPFTAQWGSMRMDIDSNARACAGAEWMSPDSLPHFAKGSPEAPAGSAPDNELAGPGEIPGARPFSPEPPGEPQHLFDASVEHRLGVTEDHSSPCTSLPPSSKWGGSLVPQSNSLAHLQLLNELDGRMPDASMQTASGHGVLQSPEGKTLEAVELPHDGGSFPSSAPGGVGTVQTLGGTSEWQLDFMTPFGAPNGYAEEMFSEGGGVSNMVPASLSIFADATGVNAATTQQAMGRLVAHDQRVIGFAPSSNEEVRKQQILLQWKEAERNRGKGSLQPAQRVEENVRDYISRARFAAGQSGLSLVSGEDRGGKTGDASLQEAWRSREESCPGSPVSSGWSQDPCGYWVQNSLTGEEPPADFDLGHWPEAPSTATPSGPLPCPIGRDGSSCDLWSTVEGEDGDVSSQHLELEKRSQVGAMGIRGKSDGGGNMNHWCDQFVPRPLQIEFARELHWFAWKGRKSSKDPSPESGKFKDEGRQSPKTAIRRGPKTRVVKQQLQSQPTAAFIPTLPCSLPGPAFAVDTSLRLRTSQHQDSDGVQEIQDDEQDDAMVEAEESNLNLNLNLADSDEARGHISRRAGCAAKRSIRRDMSCSRVGASHRRQTPCPPRNSTSCASHWSMKARSVSALPMRPAAQQPKVSAVVVSANSGLRDVPARHAAEPYAEAAAGVLCAAMARKKSECCDLLDRGNEDQEVCEGFEKRLDQVQMFKIREMLREMHCLLLSHPSLRLGGKGESVMNSNSLGEDEWYKSGDGLVWRLIMYNAMMHAESQVASAGYASINDGIAILDRMAAAGVPPTLHTYKKYLSVIDAAASRGRGNGTHVEEAFLRMAEAGIEPDRETYWAWLSVLGNAVYHGQATMEQVYWVLQNINKPASTNAIVGGEAVSGNAGDCGMGGEDVHCLHLCLRAAVGGAQRGLAGKADVEWVLRRLRALQLQSNHDTWLLAMQVLVNAAERGEASVADAERLLDKAEAAGYVSSPTLYCAFFQAAAAAANGRKQKHAIDMRERVLARVERLERLCRQDTTHPSLRHSLLPLTRAVRAYVEHESFGKLRRWHPPIIREKCAQKFARKLTGVADSTRESSD
jgi:hypothetical protein